MELHESPEKLEESIKESLFTAAKKVKPMFTKKYREASTLKKKALQMIVMEIEELKRKSKSLEEQGEDQGLKNAKVELEKAVRDLCKDLGGSVSFVANFKRDVSACLCGEELKGFQTYCTSFMAMLKKLPEWVLQKKKNYTSQSLKLFVDTLLASIGQPDQEVYSEDLAEQARDSFLDGLINGSNARDSLKAKAVSLYNQ